MTTARRKIANASESGSPTEKPDHRKTVSSQVGDALVSRVKKAIKKSRRKLTEEKFEKQLQRTIVFLDELQSKLVASKRSVGKVQRRRKVKAVKKAKPKPLSKEETIL